MLEVGKVYQHDGFVDPNPAYFIVLSIKINLLHAPEYNQIYYVILWGWGVTDEILFDGRIAENSKLIR